MSDKEDKDKGFKVTDRRIFSEKEGETAKEDIKPEEGPQKTEHAEAVREPPSRDKMGGEPEEPQEELGPIDFSQFILSLATSALIQMGEARHPQTGETHEDLYAAQQTIDILDILKNKTKGNLEPAEERLLDSLLAELRFRFVKKKGTRS